MADSDPRPTTPESAGNRDLTSLDDVDDIPWTLLTLEELIEIYWSAVAPALEADGMAPESDRPSHSWLSENGFRGLIYALREYHDRSFSEFWSDDLDLGDDSYDWGTDHDQTVELLESYVQGRIQRSGIAESTAQNLTYKLGRYVRAYVTANGETDLLSPVAVDTDIPPHEATDRAWQAMDRLDEQLAPQTVQRIHETVEDWYAHLVRRKQAGINPVAGLEDEYRWSRRVDSSGASTNPALAPDHVRALYGAASTSTERLLVIGLCAWGLRPGEVASLHRRQLVFDVADSDVPYVRFEERKNGPGEVSVLFGQEDAKDRVVELDDRDAWNGYLFPSKTAAAGHITRQTVVNWFDDMAAEAGLPDSIDGAKPVPKMGRRFWYDAYTATQDQLLAEVSSIAEEQGSASPEVVLSNYLTEDRRRRLRRQYMEERLSQAFTG